MDPSMLDDEVVISGVGGRFPESDNLEELKQVLFNQEMVITNNDLRWKPGKWNVPSQTGKVHGIDQFDTAFFGMHRKLTDATDPMSRILLEEVFEAVIDAGMNPLEVKGSSCGVFIGSAVSESENIFITLSAQNGFGIMGHNRSMMANRISYWLDVKGPSFAFDSSFSSSLKGLVLAKNAIESGECDMAIVGCAVLSFHAEFTVHLDDMEVLTEENFNRPFDEDAQGYPRSESVIIMVLQKRSAAKRVYASVCHVECCYYGNDQPGPFLDLMPKSMETLIRDVYKNSKINPDDIKYLETEGTGVKWIDELEISAVDKAICSQRTKPLPIGTVKSNLGHCEASAGLVGVCKMIVAMEHGMIPATLHHEKPNPNLKGIVEGRMQVVTENTPWEGGLVAVNAMGVGNMFVHCILRSYPKEKKAASVPDELPRLVCLSGRHEEGLSSVLEQVESRPFDKDYVRLIHDAFSCQIFSHIYRGYTFMPMVPSQSEIVVSLPDNMDVSSENAVFESTYRLESMAKPYSGGKRPVWFVYSGMGSQWPGMARDLMKVKIFREAIERCHKALEPHGVDLKHIITTEDETIFDNILHSFVGIAAVQIGLTDVLKAIGIEPDGIIGHSVGELGCAYADGCFTAEQMILAAHARGRASIETKLIRGTMAAVGLGYNEMKDKLPPRVEVACHNSSTSCTISGPDEDMMKFVADLKRENIFAKAVNVSNIAYHSKYIAPAGPKLLDLLKEVIPHPVERSPRWVSTSVPEDQWDSPLALTSSPEYHTNNLLSSVLFEEGSTKIPQNAIAIEIAPHGLLQAILRRSLNENCVNIPLTKRGVDDGALFLLKAIGKMYLAGMQLKLENLYDPVEYPVSRGTPGTASLVTWEHSDVWYTGRASQMKGTIPAENHFNVTLRDMDYRPYIHYKWRGHSILTPANCLELVAKKIRDVRDDTDLTIVFQDVHFLNVVDIPTDEPISVYVLYQRGSGKFEVSSDLVLVATGHAFVPEDNPKPLFTELSPIKETVPINVLEKKHVYSELGRRGLIAADNLAAINELVYYEKDWIGTVSHNGNNTLLLDKLLQIVQLKASNEVQDLHRPVRIERITVIHKPCPPTPDLPVRFNVATGIIQAGCVEVVDVHTEPFIEKSIFEPLLLHSYQFISHSNPSLQSSGQFMSLVVQLTRAHQSRFYATLDDTQLDVLVLKSPNFDSLQEDLNTLASRLPNVNITKKDAITTPDVLQEANKASLIMAADTSINVALSLLRNTFLLIRTPIGAHVDSARGWDKSIGRILDVTINNERYQLLRKVAVDGIKGDIIAVKENENISKFNISTKGTTYLVWNKLPEIGLYSVLEKVRGVAGCHRIRCVFLLDENVPPFDPSSPFYSEQMSHGLWVNVFHNGSWGGFYNQLIQNDAIHAEIPKDTVSFNHISGIHPMNILCIGLNPFDLSYWGQRVQTRYVGPVDFVAVDRTFLSKHPTLRPRRIMGLAAPSDAHAALNLVPEFQWLVPEQWTTEEAATVPYAYSMAYHAVVDLAELDKDQYALVHDGASPIGQAAIRVAFSVKGKVITSVTCDEERKFLKELFPQIPDDHIVDINDPDCDLRIRYATGGHTLMCILSNVRGTALENTFRCINYFGTHIQLGTEDAKRNRKLRLFTFVRSAQFCCRNSTYITSSNVETKLRTRDMVAQGIYSGVVQPLKRVVYNIKHADQAVSKVNNSNSKVVVSLRPDATVALKNFVLRPDRELYATPIFEKEEPDQNQKSCLKRYKCSPDISYLIIGGRDGFAIDILEWLLKRGARHVTVAGSAGHKDSNTVYESERRFNFLGKYYSANITVAQAGERPDNQARATALLQRARADKPLGTIFILPMDEPAYGQTIQHVDAVSQAPEFERAALIVVRRGGHSQRAVATCERRRRAGLRAGVIDVGTASTYVSLLPLDRLIPLALSASASPAAEAPEGVGAHPVLNVMQQPGRHDEQRRVLSEFLPRTLSSAVALGKSIKSHSYFKEICTSSRKIIREVPPIFLIPGLTDGLKEQCKDIADNLIVPAVVLSLPESIKSIQQAAESLIKIVLDVQPKGPYTILGMGWSGAVALELALALEAMVPKHRWDKDSNAVFLIDAAPNTILETLPTQVHTRAFEAKLLCHLLHLDLQVFDFLEGLPNWDERVKSALALLPPDALSVEDKPFLEEAYRNILQRLQALRAYQGPSDGRRLRGEVTLMRPAGFDHNYRCGLEVYCENVPLVHTPSRAVAHDRAKTLHEVGLKISEGLRVGNKKMSLDRFSMNHHTQLVWQRLR